MHDNLTQVGAIGLADRIKQFWIAKGFNGVQTFITTSQCSARPNKSVGMGNFWIVKSNIGPKGWPPFERTTGC